MADRGCGQAGRVHLDDGEVRQRVDAVHRAGKPASVLELYGELVGAGDHVAVGEDPARGVIDDPGADALGRHAPEGVRALAVDGDLDHRRADLCGGVDDRGGLIDGDGLLADDLLHRARAGWRGWPVKCAGPVQDQDRAAGREDRGQKRCGDDRADARTASAPRRHRGDRRGDGWCDGRGGTPPR